MTSSKRAKAMVVRQSGNFARKNGKSGKQVWQELHQRQCWKHWENRKHHFSTRSILVLELGHGLSSSSLVHTKQILSGVVTTEDEVERTRKQEGQEERLKSKKLITETKLRKRSGRRSHQDPIQSFRCITLSSFPLSSLFSLFSIASTLFHHIFSSFLSLTL